MSNQVSGFRYQNLPEASSLDGVFDDDDLVGILLTEQRSVADEAWGRLAEADIPAFVVTEPGIMGAYQLTVQVTRRDLEKAQALLGDLAAG